MIKVFLCLASVYGMSVEVSRAALKEAMSLPSLTGDRRLVSEEAVLGRRPLLLSAGAAALLQVAAVDASGGATAGGAYLLRAKERYSERVKKGALAFKEAEKAFASGDSSLLTSLFAKDGPYDDLCTAGFLLSNAFRINSTQNPDKIPQVQKFKAFKASADSLPLALKKKKLDTPSFQSASDLLSVFLSSVEISL